MITHAPIFCMTAIVQTRKCHICNRRKSIYDYAPKRLSTTFERNKTCISCCRRGSIKYAINWKSKKDKYREQHVRWQSALKAEVFGHYGGRCVCCGESDMRFLSLDHVRGDGRRHRDSISIAKSGAGSVTVWYWAKKNNFPSTLQVLCYNCNFAKRTKILCPHQEDNDTAWERMISEC